MKVPLRTPKANRQAAGANFERRNYYSNCPRRAPYGALWLLYSRPDYCCGAAIKFKLINFRVSVSEHKRELGAQAPRRPKANIYKFFRQP